MVPALIYGLHTLMTRPQIADLQNVVSRCLLCNRPCNSFAAMRSEMKSYKENQITERFQAHKEQWDVISYIVYVQTDEQTLRIRFVEHVVRR